MSFRLLAAAVAALFLPLLAHAPAQATSVTASLTLYPSTALAGDTVEAYAGASCCNITTYTYDWGDGNTTSGTDYYAYHSYNTVGTYTVSLTVKDVDGNVATTTRTETIINDQPPVASLTISQKTSDTTGMSIYADTSASSDTDSTGIYYEEVYFGDGGSASGYTSTGQIYGHQYTSPGTYTVTAYVYDSNWNDGVVSATVAVPFSGPQPPTTVQEGASPVQLNGWESPSDSLANGGSIHTSKVAGDFASYKFSGASIAWRTRKGPFQGSPTVYIDGVNKGTVNLYSASLANYAKTYTGLSAGIHTIKIQVAGKSASSRGINSAVDAFQVGSTVTQDTNLKITYDSWTGAASTSANGGAYRISGAASATAAFTFNGTSVSWITAKGPAYGKADVTIDGVDKGVVDLYASTVQWKVAKTYSGLSSGTHTIRLHVLGTKRASSSGRKVVLDAFTY